MRLWTLFFAALAIGCNGSDKDIDTADTDTAASSDLDGDGFTEAGGDCDDDDPTVHPEADEVWYDGVDQNCDQLSDYDQDADGVDQDADCDDTNADISPDAPETCNAIDDDCDGEVDETGTFTAYLDADADGFGTGDALGTYCELPAGTADNADDCDDTNAAISPAADEVCDGIDNDCDATADDDAVDGTTVYSDADLDGYGDAATARIVCELPEGVVGDGSDCDDTDAASFPGATEVCDLEDNNCDGAVDEGAIDPRTYYADADGDGYGDATVTAAACGAPDGYVEADTDCDDADATRSPGATEVCDGLENDCDGEVDTDAVDALLLYVDADLDGFGDDATLVASCAVIDGYVDLGGDCDDTLATVSPAADEVCDTVDNNCDGASDESTAVDAPTWYLDADADGYGSAGASAPSCTVPEGFAASADDCDDLDATAYPDATELCDERDNDCDGAVDDGAADATAWYADADGDSFGDASAGAAACEQPDGYVADDQDCDDADALSFPGAAETCDGQDQDCDGATDDDPVDGFAVYADGDGDGYGDAVVSVLACAVEDGWTTDLTDCDDAAAGVNPGADEVCGGADDDCDGTIDEPDAVDAATWYDDADGDGYGNVGTGTTACDAPVGTVATATDCDDGAASTYPGAAETCDNVDQDCDGTVDDGAVDAGTWYADADGDRFGNASVTTSACDAPAGYVADASDCDDASAAAYPGAAETCDDRDNDCDGSTDEAGAEGETTWYLDADGDDYGVSSGTMDACDQPAGYAPTPDDCDDGDEASNPGASERDDGADNDCDGLLDEDFVAPGDIIVTEIHRQPRFGATSTNTNGQWFELYNTTDTDIDLSNWYIQRVSSTLAADGYYIDPADGVVVGAGDYVTFCKTDNFVSSSTSYSTMAPCDYYWGNETAAASYAGTYEDNTFNLQRDEDTLALYVAGNAATGTLVDAVSWTYDATDGYWPRDASRSMQLDPDAYDATSNDSLDNWCSTTNNGFFRWYNASVSAREYGTPASDNHNCP